MSHYTGVLGISASAPVRAASRHVLGLSVTVRPVSLRYLHEVDHQVLRSHSWLFAQQLGDLRVEVFLLLYRAPLIQSDLDKDDVVSAVDAKVARIVDQTVFSMFGEDHELIVLGGTNRFEERLIDTIGESSPVVGGLPSIRSMRTRGMFCTSR